MRIKNTLKELSLNDLHRIYKNENKEFLSVEISVFNAGHVVRAKLTNSYKTPHDNGYNFIVYNDQHIKTMIKDVLKEKMANMLLSWGKNCYYYNWEDFLKTYKISETMFLKIKRIVEN